METFTWSPLLEPQGTKKYRKIVIQFGDGYSQAIGSGINSKSQNWKLSFRGREGYIRPILEFLDRHEGRRPFLWTPPMGDEGLYRSGDPDITALGNKAYTVDVTFEQVFYP